MKKFIYLIFLYLFLSSNALCYELDTSFDDEIRKKYNVEELNEKNADKIQLPKLPDIAPEEVSRPSSYTHSVNFEYFPENYTGNVKILKSGARFLVANTKRISDNLPKGTIITFYSLEDINWKGIKIPQGTMFRGEIVQSHTPQLTGNGGLVKIQIDEFVYNKTLYKIDSVISKVEDKRVFNGKIKGKRQYWNNVKKANNFGIKANRKMNKAARSIGKYPVIGILSIIPIAIGGVTLIGNSVVSPIISVFKTGSHSVIQRGSIFEIKLTDDVKLKA